MSKSELSHQVHGFLQHLTNQCSRECGLGSMTPAIYDTAWVSMVSKKINGNTQWLFPECFTFLLDTQLPDGGWESYATAYDGILNTMAALLAMKKHGSSPENAGSMLPLDLESRMSKAIVYLQNKLEEWDFQATNHTGFEILMPAHLSMLEAENIVFNFPGRQYLMSIYPKKFDPVVLYGKKKTTFLCSLEAFIGKVEFDRVSHHRTFGSFMGSPASTAAYLMNSSSWDNEAEHFLRTTMLKGQGNGNGGLPMLFPSTIMELVWPLSTFVEYGVFAESLNTVNINHLASYLEKHLQAQNGLLGFAPSILEDADCTAKTILTLNLLGRPTTPDRMIDHYRAKGGYLETYVGERDSSISPNCNVLNALLHVPNVSKYSNQIFDIAKSLCDAWWDGTFQDKRNLSLYYSMMLLAEALMSLLLSWERDQLGSLPQNFLSDRISVVLLQICNRTLLGQDSDGSWGPPEVTAYAVLTLLTLSSLPHVRLLEMEIASAIKTGRQSLSQSQDRWAEAHYVWIGKVTFGVPVISQAYCLAAMSALPRPYSSRPTRLVTPSSEAVEKKSQVLSRLPMFMKVPYWKVKASVIEAYSLLPGLKRTQENIFSHRSKVDKAYPDYIPCIWIVINNCMPHFLNTNLVCEMVLCSLLCTLADGYMESIIAQLPQATLDTVEEIIRCICEKPNAEMDGRQKWPGAEGDNSEEHKAISVAFNGGKIPESDSEKQQGKSSGTSPKMFNIADEITIVSSIKISLDRWAKYFLWHPQVRRSSPYDQEILRYELHAQIQSNLTQIRDSKQLSQQFGSTRFLNPRTSFYRWVYTDGADNSFYPFMWAFHNCLVGGRSSSGEKDCFPTARAKYFAKDLCTHLAVMTRLYNDYSSVGRDHAEQNLNSVDFPEFHAPDSFPARQNSAHGSADAAIGLRNTSSTHEDPNQEAEEQEERERKSHVLALARYEQQCATFAKDHLMTEMRNKDNGERGKWARQAVNLFVDLTQCYGELCTARDSSPRVK